MRNSTCQESAVDESLVTDRRLVLGSMAAFAIASPAYYTSARAEDDPIIRLPRSPEEHLNAIVRLIGSAVEEDVPWWYRGIVYAQNEDQRPLPLFRIEGVETYWFRHGGDGTYWVSTRTLTFIRDFATNQMIWEFQNPFTGQVNEVTPNILTGTDSEQYSTDGILSTRIKQSDEKAGSLQFDWTVVGPHVFLIKDRGLPTAPQPWLEAQSPSAPADAFFNPELDRFPSFFSSTYLAPYPTWMDMGDRPGHVVWHSTGGKVQSTDDLPEEYLARARAEYPEMLSAKPE